MGAAFTYVLWLRGIARLEPSVVSTLGFLSPTSAVILGWMVLDQHLTLLQMTGVLTVLASLWLSQWAGQRRRLPVASAPATRRA